MLGYQNFKTNAKITRKNKIAALPQNADISATIHDNLKTMSSDEKIIILKKIISNELIDNILLTYALNNVEIETKDVMSLDEFMKAASDILIKYHPKAGGHYFDDDEWALYTCKNDSNNDYILEDGECIFENTIPYVYYTNEETQNFIKNIIKILNKLAKNIAVCEKKMYVKSEHSIILHIRALDKNLVNFEKFKEKKLLKY